MFALVIAIVELVGLMLSVMQIVYATKTLNVVLISLNVSRSAGISENADECDDLRKHKSEGVRGQS